MNTPTPEEACEAVEFLYERAHEFMPSSAGTLISSDTLRRFIDAHSAPVQPEPVAWRVYFPDEQRQEYCDHLDELIEDLTNCRHDEPEPLFASPPPAQPASNPWRDAIDEALVVAHLGVATEPYDDLNKLLQWHHDVWLDPAVSSDAQALIDRGAAEERARAAQPKREALTDAEIRAGLNELGSDDLWGVVGAYFMAGVRFSERRAIERLVRGEKSC